METTWILNAVLLLACLVLGSMAYASLRAAPWVPAKKQDRANILEALEIKANDKLYDLGCGDGWLACAAARLGAQVVGYEISLPVYLAARLKAMSVSGPGSVKIRCRDFWGADLSGADAVFVFLMPKAMDRLRAKFENECHAGTRVVSYAFPIFSWEPVKKIQPAGQHAIYVYRVPAKTQGENCQT